MIAFTLNMIAILFSILGFVALVLLYLLLFVLILILLVLFVPFWYRAEGSYNNGNVTGYGRASWLLGLLSLTFDDTNTITARVLGIRVWRFTEQKTPEATPSPAETKVETKTQSTEKTVNNITAETNPPPANTAKNKIPSYSEQKQEEQQSDEPKKSIKGKFTEFSSKIKNTWDQIQYYKNHPDRSEIISQAKLLIKRTIKSVLPKRLEISGTYGFEDPSQTGFATAGISIVTQFVYPRIRINTKPDFTQQVINLSLLVKGKIWIIALLVPMLKFLFSKPIWRLLMPLIFPKKNKKGAVPNGKQFQQQH